MTPTKTCATIGQSQVYANKTNITQQPDNDNQSASGTETVPFSMSGLFERLNNLATNILPGQTSDIAEDMPGAERTYCLTTEADDQSFGVYLVNIIF